MAQLIASAWTGEWEESRHAIEYTWNLLDEDDRAKFDNNIHIFAQAATMRDDIHPETGELFTAN